MRNQPSCSHVAFICQFQVQDTLDGLEYLHSPEVNVCHGDLKSVRRIDILQLTDN